MDFKYLKYQIENSSMSSSEMILSNTGDGRLDSAESEYIVVEHLKKLFDNTEIKVYESPEKRWWYDVLIEYNGQRYPINIKMTNGNAADNISSKLGVYYALTGIWPENQPNLIRWANYNNSLVKNLNFETEADYYFIVYFKDTKTFLFTSLKRIEKLKPNGNNLPFQCKWKENQVFTYRNKEDQIHYIMNVYCESWLKKVQGIEPLLQWRETYS